MGLRRRLLRAQWDCVHSVVSAGIRQYRRDAAREDRENSSEYTRAGCARVAVEAVPRGAVPSRGFVDRKSRGKRAGPRLAVEYLKKWGAPMRHPKPLEE